MKKLLLLTMILSIFTLSFAQNWEVVKESTMEYPSGDGPYGGYFLDANTGWLVNKGGRVQKTTDGGLNWETTRESDNGDNWVDVEFADANVGYACSYDGFIFKSTDGGVNWTMVGDTANYTEDLKDLSVVNADIVYFAGKNSTLLKTIDGGASYTKSAFDFDGEDLDGGIAFCDANVGVVISDATGGHTWYTANGGTDWTYVSAGAYFPPGTGSTRIYDVAAVGTQTIIITGYHYVTLLSNDGGQTYTRIGEFTYDFKRNELVDAVDENTFFIAGDYLARTTDGGATFDTLLTGSGQGFDILEFTDANNGFVVQSYGNWKQTTDGGSTWTEINDWPAMSFWGIGLPDENKVVLSAWGGGEISISEDGGNTFSYPSNLATKSLTNLYECEFVDANTGFIGGGSGTLLKTIDGGTTYNQINNTMATESKTINAMHVYNSDVIFAGGSSGYVMKSSDGGNTWTDTKINSSTVYDIFALDENTVITSAASGKICYGVFDGDAVVTDSLIIDVGSNSMRAVKVRNNVVLIPTSKGKIYRADVNSLATIADVFTEPDGDDFYDVEFVTDSLVYVVGEAGKIYKSEDAGLNWTVEVSNTEETLHKVKFANDKLWVVGKGGTVLSLNLSNEPTLMTIADAKIDADEDGALDLIDQEIKIKGVVTSPNYGYNSQYFLQDETAGIVLYSGSVGVELNIGDEIEIIGTLSQYAGLSQIQIDDASAVSVVSTGNVVVPTPVKLSELGEDYEAMLVCVEPVKLLDASQWPADGKNGSVDIVSGLDTSYIYIDKESDLDGWATPPTGWIKLIAVCDQYTTYSLRGTIAEHFVDMTPTLPLVEAFTDGTFDQEWTFNTWSGAVSLDIADSSSSAWGSHVGVFTDSGYTGLAHISDVVAEDYTVSSDIHIIGPADASAPLYAGLGIKMAHSDLAYYRLVYRNSSSSNNGQIKLQGYDGASWHISAAWNPGVDFDALETGWHNFKVTVEGNQFWVYIDNQLMPGCPYVDEDPFLTAGYPGIYKYNGGVSSILFDNFTVTENPTPITDIVINEFLASNDAACTDENGEYDDFIELYNKGDVAINVGGLYVTDDLTDPTLWQIPVTNSEETTIQPGGFLLLWADKEEDQGVLHLKIKLSGNGEQIGLVQVIGSDTTFVDSLSYTEQTADISYGRYEDGANNWITMTPSPNAANNNGITAIDDENGLPTTFALSQNYPNPFNPTTSISFDLPKASNVTLIVYNLQGQKVSEIVNNYMQAGRYDVNLDASHFASGVYIYKMQAGNFLSIKKMTLLK